MSKDDMERKWLPNIAELIDRLSIHQLKEFFVEDNKEKYRSEMKDILHDIEMIIRTQDVKMTGELIKAIVLVSQINAHIWYNEARARRGEEQDLTLLKLTHGLNGIRMKASNKILQIFGQLSRQETKVDCLAAEHAKWDIEI